MSSSLPEPRSIAAQLVAWFTVAAALLLCCALGILYSIVAAHAAEEDKAVLADKVRAVRADLDNASNASALRAELQARPPQQHAPYWTRVSDSTGAVLGETPGMTDALPARLFPHAIDSRGSTTERQVGRRLFSLFSATHAAGGQTYTIQIAQDRSEDEQFARRFRALLGGVGLAGAAAAAVIAVTVTRRGLRPLNRMTSAVREITAVQLSARVSASHWPREIRPLALAFDSMLDRLEDSFGRLSQFSADLAHELRTPVANIRGEAEVALTRSRTTEEYQDVLESTVAECERLSAIIDNLLFLARAEAADRQLRRTVFDARAAAQKLAAYYGTAAEERRIEIECAGEGEIAADPILFDRAVSNLLDNALRFTPDGGHIRVRVTREANACTITVSDTGSGIAAEHLPRVFDRFYRTDPARTAHGAGLGLSLVQSIAKMHGGSATIASTPGAGTTVTLEFPDGRLFENVS